MFPTYRYSSRAKKYYHVKLHAECPTPVNGSKFSDVCCGMFDRSSKGNWQQTSLLEFIPAHLIICPTCERLS